MYSTSCHFNADVRDYNVVHNVVHNAVLQLTNEPFPVRVTTVDDDVYEGTETLSLTLAQTRSSNSVTFNQGLIFEKVLITLKDNDSMLHTIVPPPFNYAIILQN